MTTAIGRNDRFVVHKPEFFGIGGWAKAMIGIGQRDFCLAPYGRLELGGLYLGVGPLFPIKELDDFVQLDGMVSFFSTLGFGIPLDSIANGKRVLDVGLDASITPSPIIVADSGNFVADLFASISPTPGTVDVDQLIKREDLTFPISESRA